MNIKKIVAGTTAFLIAFSSVLYYNNNIKIISNAVENIDYTEGTCGSMQYRKYSDHIEIYNCSVSATDVVIPDRLYGLPVTVICDDAFMWCSISSITIPESVSLIGNRAFYGCKYLENIVIENPKCILGSDFVPTYTIIYGYDNSTAHEYSDKNQENNFYAVDTTVTTATTTITTTLITTNTTTATTTSTFIIPTTTASTVSTTSPIATTTYPKTTTLAKTTYYSFTRTTTTTMPKILTILPKTMSIRVNDNKELTILNCGNPDEIRWISSNDEVAVVENGKVVGLSKGSATIYATIGNSYGEITVEVNDKIIESDEPIKGDINGDNVIDSSDSSILLAYYAYKSSGGKLSLEAFLNMK